MSTKHTPGPWEIERYSYGLIQIVGDLKVISDDEEHFTTVVEQISATNEESNARLIAAAPELLEALVALVKINEEHNQSFIDVIGKPLNWKDDYLDAARAAIRKALGEEK